MGPPLPGKPVVNGFKWASYQCNTFRWWSRMGPDLIETCDIEIIEWASALSAQNSQLPGKIIAWARRATTMSFDDMTAWAQTFIRLDLCYGSL